MLLAYSIYQQIMKQPDWQQSTQQIGIAIRGEGWWRIGLVVLLMIFNWGLEAQKWRLALKTLQPISFGRALKAVLTGVTIGSFTPNRTGEYLGRVLYIEESKRLRAILLSVVCSMAQLLTTLAMAIPSALLMLHYLGRDASAGELTLVRILEYILFGALVACLLLSVFYFRLPAVVRVFEKGYLKKLDPIVKVLQELKTPVLLRIFCLSFGRYLVFLAQYALLFSVFGVELTAVEVFTGISVMFLIMAIVPSLTFLTDLGLRWEASIRIMRLFSSNNAGILAVSLGIWIINLIMPALIGSLLILRIKLFRSR